MLGDHIRALMGGRWTHGIDCGDETILHASDGARARIVRTYRPLFVAGAQAVEVVAHREPVFAATSVVARAFTPIRDPALAAMFRDSEAFAHWCKSGRMLDAARSVALEAPAGARPPEVVARETPAPPPRPPRRRPAKPKARPSRPVKKAPARAAPPKRTTRPRPKRTSKASARKIARPAAAARRRKGRR